MNSAPLAANRFFAMARWVRKTGNFAAALTVDVLIWPVAALCAAAASILAVPGSSGLFGGGLAIVAIAIAATDARQLRIPDKLVIAGLTLGLARAAILGSDRLAAVASAGLRGAVLALILLAFRLAYRRIRQREGIGLGDVKLSAVAGVWLTWTEAALAIDCAALAALAAVLISGFRAKRISRDTRVPFGLFFAPAIWIAWLIGAVATRGIF
jgi:leader peptidase (prepilin peptidase) / N-methyltransferase